MKRILLLVTVALMLAAAMALSGVAQAAPISTKADAQCAKEAIKTLGPSFNPANYTFIGGTALDDRNTLPPATEGPDVFCGFDGNDVILTLEQGDIFLGGAGIDRIVSNYGTVNGGEGNDFVDSNYGTFNGGAGNDRVAFSNYGTFNGGEGNDFVISNYGTFNGGDGVDGVSDNYADATFNGGAGIDLVALSNFGTVNGGEGNDSVYDNNGTVNGGAGDDSVAFNHGTFNGGDGVDSVTINTTGTTDSVENLPGA